MLKRNKLQKNRNLNNKNKPKRNNNQRKTKQRKKNNQRRKNSPRRRLKKKNKRKIHSNKKRKLTHLTRYQSPHSTLMTLKEKFATLQTNWRPLKNYGKLLILKDGHSGDSTTLNTKVIFFFILGEGTVGYLTNNLKNGYLRNIDHFRKYTFATLGVFGVEGNYEIDGVWLWRGT